MEEVSPIQGLTYIPTHSHLILSASKQCRSLSTSFMEEMTVMGGACPISDLVFLRRMKQVSWIVSCKGVLWWFSWCGEVFLVVVIVVVFGGLGVFEVVFDGVGGWFGLELNIITLSLSL